MVCGVQDNQARFWVASRLLFSGGIEIVLASKKVVDSKEFVLAVEGLLCI